MKLCKKLLSFGVVLLLLAAFAAGAFACDGCTEVNKDALSAAIEATEGHEQSNYLADTWTTFYAARNNAITFYENPVAAQDGIDEALARLEEAVEGLTTPLQALENAIYEAEQLQESRFTAATWSTLSERLEEARELLNDDDATDELLVERANALVNAINGLAGRPADNTVRNLIILGAFVVILVVIVIIIGPAKVMNYFRGMRAELKKVTWPSWEKVVKNTGIVLMMMLIVAVIIGVFDFVWTNTIRFILDMS